MSSGTGGAKQSPSGECWATCPPSASAPCYLCTITLCPPLSITAAVPWVMPTDAYPAHCKGMGSIQSAVRINGGLGKRMGDGSRPRPKLSEGLSDREIAEALGVRLKRFLAVLCEAGLRPYPKEHDA